jgi:hypothetical protein
MRIFAILRHLVLAIVFAFTALGMLTAGLADALTYEYNNRSELLKVRDGTNTLFSWEYDLAGDLKYYSCGTVGASKGSLTTRIKIHVNKDGRNLHAFPY